MTWKRVSGVLVLTLGLCGCGQVAVGGGGGAATHGRYSGVGLYSPGRQWTKMMAAQQAADSPSARPADDQVIIVVQDSATGDIRACGDLTGYCIGMNPWKTALVSGQMAPVRLTEHVPPPEPAAQTRAVK